MRSSLRFACAAFIATAGLFATVEASSAMPAAPAHEAGASSMLQDVRWGCGPGWHPNPWGHCVPNWRRPGIYYGGGWGHRRWYGHGGRGWNGGWHGGHRGWHGGRRIYRH